MEGRTAEDQACEYLRAQGMLIVARNWRWRGGEVDIIAKDGPVLVFVEVRSRTDASFVPPEATVDERKKARLWRTAQAFLAGKPLVPVRFDVVAVTPQGLSHIPGAFDSENVRACP